ncbi:glycosyltransferase family 4 protein [Ktedonosporobacter rubrisoli]|uniref:Glycosyltransferase family 4 protein n=1 Tax=Ktedonosporobacter rubrisoli TaxID=2509675 RepID=A0A4P6JY33_KTERU|nr:glycosyltransferase [Ktedonosporobacter rubrisoli]QBD79936.1 glycosyltransferase family 4 protein [Ktedonosporobacter rubrisoli]
MLAELARGLVERGHEVTLFAHEGSSVPGVRLEQIAVPENVLPANFSSPGEERAADRGFFAQANIFLELFLQLQQRQHEFDLIHAHAFDWPAFTCSALLSELPVIHTIHLPAVSPEINAMLGILHRQGHPLTLVTVSQACAQTYADYTPFDHIIYNGLKIEEIPFSAEVAEDAPLLLAGRITPEKGVETAIEIAERAGTHLLIAGGIYDRAYYEERIAPRLQNAPGRITYLGLLDHARLWQIMGQARGLLFPIAWDEPFGLTAVEAMAAGTPVIAFQRGAATEIVRHGETGFLVEPGNSERAASFVPELANLARARCRSFVEMRFSFTHMIDTYEHVYSSLLSG